jgi:hypothetical protein
MDFSDEDDDDDFDDDFPENIPKSQPKPVKEDTPEEEKHEEEEEDPRFNRLQICDEFKLKESPAGNKVFYNEDDIEFELLKLIGQGGFCKVYHAMGTYL